MKRHHLKYLIISIAMFSTLIGVETFAIDAQPAPPAIQTPTSNVPITTAPTTASNNVVVPATEQIKTAQTLPSATVPPESRPSPILKFLAAMAGVLLSSLAIFGGLKLYKKFVLKNNLKTDNTNYSKTLESPKTFKEAINIFLDKTDK